MINNSKPSRSFAKAITWRLIGSMDTFILSYILTGRFTIAFSIGSAEVFTKTALYYLHERAWNKIELGKENDEKNLTV